MTGTISLPHLYYNSGYFSVCVCVCVCVCVGGGGGGGGASEINT